MTKLRPDDWEHRLMLLRAWQSWRDYIKYPDTVPAFDNRDGNDGRRNSYNAVIDGCAITVRALCQVLDLYASFKQFESKLQNARNDRHDALMACCNSGLAGFNLINGLDDRNERLRLLEVLFLGNRAVAHPRGGMVDHAVSPIEMTSAINTLLQWLQTENATKAEIAAVKAKRSDLFEPIPMPRP
jgi:hypothetical protein